MGLLQGDWCPYKKEKLGPETDLPRSAPRAGEGRGVQAQGEGQRHQQTQPLKGRSGADSPAAGRSHHAADALIRNLQLPGLWDHKALSLRALRGGTLLGQPWETNKHRGIGKGEKAPCIQALGQGTSDVGHRGQGTCAPNPDPCVILSAPVLGSEALKRPLFPRKGPQLV